MENIMIRTKKVNWSEVVGIITEEEGEVKVEEVDGIIIFQTEAYNPIEIILGREGE